MLRTTTCHSWRSTQGFSRLKVKEAFMIVGIACGSGGDPDDNAMRANAWGTDRYIALHSNAKGSAQCGAGAANAGTWAYYRPGSPVSQNLATSLKNKVGAVGPGTNDQILSGSEFYEINQPNVPPVLLEAEFHDYQAGKDWLVSYSDWAWRIAWAVDAQLGYQ